MLPIEHQWNETQLTFTPVHMVICAIALTVFAAFSLLYTRITPFFTVQSKRNVKDQILDDFCKAICSDHPSYLVEYSGDDDVGKRARYWRQQIRINAPAVTQLFLSKKGLKHLPPEIGCFTSLQELSLQGNNLEGLPKEFYQLRHLKQVDLSGNTSRALYPAIYELIHTGGRKLSLDFCQLMGCLYQENID